MALNEMTALGEAASAGTTYDNYVDATGNVTKLLPPIEVMYGQSIRYTKTDATAGILTIEPCEATGVTIAGSGDTSIDTQYESITLHADHDSTNWIIISASGSGSGDVTLTGVQTLTNKTLTSPKINTVLTTSGATKTAMVAEPVDPVNYTTIAIAATGEPVYQQADGSDTNISMGLFGKGSGGVLLSSPVTEGTHVTVRPGGAGTYTRKVAKVTGMTDNTFVDLFTVTVPNAAHGAGIIMRCVGTLGDADSTACDEYFIALSRQAGEATVLEGDINVTSVAQPSATGAETITMTFQLSGLTGAVGATQTFTVQGKIARGGGASDNHYLTYVAEVLNQNTAGVTVS